mmetsp:Transcript_72553/g.212832  ORF Transcript_72553/g.212832 Transcript_72553/m.212832 type:complete len:203 (+) Transcript_72553:73-681(+)
MSEYGGDRPLTGASGRSGRSGRSATSRVSASFSHNSRASAQDCLRVPPQDRRWEGPPRMVQAGRLSVTGIPGYTGYVPGKMSENIYGTRYQNANDLSATKVDMLRAGMVTPGHHVSRTFNGPRPGSEVPGYTGFVPGRKADNVLGVTVARGAETSHLIKTFQNAEQDHKRAHYAQGVRPPTGYMDYSGYRSQILAPGVDTKW